MIDLDLKLQTLQTKLTASLTGVTAYHRAFVNRRDGQRVPEVQTVDSIQYVDKLLDHKTPLSFFVVDPVRTVISRTLFQARVYLYYAVNLDTLYPTVTERAEEYLVRDVTRELRYTEFELVGLKTGITSFTDDFDFVKDGDNLEPYFLCRFECLVEHTIKNC